MEKENVIPINVLFISRAYPPTKGGIERQNKETFSALSKKCNVQLVRNPYGKAFIPLFLPYAFLIALFSKKNDIILFGDGVLSVIGFLLRPFRDDKMVSFIHGLDITFRNPVYQRLWVKHFIPKLDSLIVPSQATWNQALKNGIPKEKLQLIPDGVSIPRLEARISEENLEKILGRKIQGLKLFTLGRLVKRKGVEWFIRSVLPLLDQEWVYIVAGDGKERENIQRAVKECQFEQKVILLGEVSEGEKTTLLRNSDVFIQPNISVTGDIEGFGLVVLEAGAHETPVVATSIDGLRDAITDGENGFLINEGDAEKFASRISKLQRDEIFREECGRKSRAFCQENLTWDHMAIRIIEVCKHLLN